MKRVQVRWGEQIGRRTEGEREQEMAQRVGRKTHLNNSLISEEAGAAVHVFCFFC